MPIYEYQREDGTVFEYSQKMSDDPLEVCPETGQKVKKLISRTTFRLEGSGWYQTDYGGSSNASSGGSTGSEESTSSDSSDTSSAPAASESGSDSCAKSSCGCADD